MRIHLASPNPYPLNGRDSRSRRRRAARPLHGLFPLLIALFTALAMPASAAPPESVDVTLEKVSPLKDGAHVYMKITGATFADPIVGRWAVDLFLRNNEPKTVRIDHVRIDFDDPPIPPIILDAGLQMWCPFPAPAMAPKLTPATGLDLPPGAYCRLGLTPDPLLDLPAPAKARISIVFDGIFFGLSDLERDLIDHTHPTPTGSYRYPAKSQDLAPGHFWSGVSPGATSNHRFSRSNEDMIHAYDTGVIRFDSVLDKWVGYHVPEPGEIEVMDENEDFLGWGMPIYAMADGEVEGCVWGQPDDTPEKDNGSIANAFTIRHGDEVAWYGHLRQGSVNQSICFDGALVEEGELLGELGNSGQTSGVPHLHIQVTRNSDPMPLQFNDTFVIEREVAFVDPPDGNEPWAAMVGLGYAVDKSATWPGPIVRRGDVATGIPVADTDVTSPSATRTVSASRTAAGDLETWLWQTDGGGEVLAIDSELGGAVGELSLAVPTGTSDAALALITGKGYLKIIAYDLGPSTLVRTGERTDVPVSGVAAASGPYGNGVLTALENPFGELEVVAWGVYPDTGVIQRRGEVSGGPASDPAIARTFAFPGVVTAARSGLDRLELTTVQADFDGWILSRVDESEDDERIEEVAISRIGLRSTGEDLVVTASRTSHDRLELISWAIDPAGTITRLADARAGTIGEVSLGRASQEHVLTAVSDASGDLKLIAWHVADDGTFTRRGEISAGYASGLAQAKVTQTFGLSEKMTVTALSDAGGKLELIAWQTQLLD